MRRETNHFIISFLVLLIAFVIFGCASVPELESPTPIQKTLNTMPGILINGINMKFQFGGNTWKARVNGEDYITGTFISENTNRGCILTLKQTYEWRVASTGEKVAGFFDRVIGGPLTALIAGPTAAAKAVSDSRKAENEKMWRKTSGPEIILEYVEGPPATLSVK